MLVRKPDTPEHLAAHDKLAKSCYDASPADVKLNITKEDIDYECHCHMSAILRHATTDEVFAIEKVFGAFLLSQDKLLRSAQFQEEVLGRRLEGEDYEQACAAHAAAHKYTEIIAHCRIEIAQRQNRVGADDFPELLEPKEDADAAD